jgi:hypothetical protein
MPTLTAVRKNAWLKAHYERLLARGKRPNVALVAYMRSARQSRPSRYSHCADDGAGLGSLIMDRTPPLSLSKGDQTHALSAGGARCAHASSIPARRVWHTPAAGWELPGDVTGTCDEETEQRLPDSPSKTRLEWPILT